MKIINCKKIFFLATCVVSFLLVIGYVLFNVSKSRSFQFFGKIVNRVETQDKIVALTFDDAPNANLDQVLKILDEKQVKATFYVVGKAIEDYPLQSKKIADAGMEIGNHSYSHQRFLLKSPGFVAAEVEKTNQLIRDAGYKGIITFRPPNGKKLLVLPWYLQQHDITTVMWDVEADTFLPQELSDEDQTNFLVEYTVNNTRPGSIILLHPFCETCGNDRQAIGRIIDQLQSRGYKFVTISELITQKEN